MKRDKKLVEELQQESETGPVDVGRRKAMQKIAVGVGVLAGIAALPEQWTKPIVGQMVLPAHAQTSGTTTTTTPAPTTPPPTTPAP